jgi:N-acetylmuramoyl-L-alanine amidase
MSRPNGRNVAGRHINAPLAGLGERDAKGGSVLLRIVGITAAALVAAAPASAHVVHRVQTGETLWSIADSYDTTTTAVAAANGMSENGPLLAGQTVQIPSDALPAGAPPTGAYTVRLGDTLSGIAARSGLSVEQLAWMNGLDPGDALLAGTALKLPSSAALASAASPAPTHFADTAPHPTEEFVDAAFVQDVALQHGVPPSLAAGIAHQESGFNNAKVSASNARGVMQILPGTWNFIQSSLAPTPLEAASAHDNVHAGVLYLRQLLTDTGGDEVMATAAYYQGLASVRKHGLFAATRAYVASVMALRQRYAG